MAIFPLFRKRIHPSNNASSKVETFKALGGVYVSTKGWFSRSSHSTASIYVENSSSSSSHSWKPSDDVRHIKNVPLIVTDPDQDSDVIEDPAEALGLVMNRARKLPTTWYFSSNHVMVNQERTKWIIAPLTRLSELDDIARDHAKLMAIEQNLHHVAVSEIQSRFDRNCRRLGQNVSVGCTIRDIHQEQMKTTSDRNNILDRRYTHMGMGTARGVDGNLYLCQIFRG